MSTRDSTTAAPDADPTDPQDRRFDGPWLAALAAAVVGWTLLYALDWAFLTPSTPVGAAVAFAHGYLLAPLATATLLLDSLSLAERRVADLGLFKWIYALAALPAPPVAAVYYLHREWLRPDDATLLGGP
ncbi:MULTISPECIES: hypothetical protein [Halorubrum]|uniref:DUF3817 domain-containing protein n=1 Tax=Halorubrum tropicale TaxID=1765655 RepID=A0A0N0BRS9_9EURY|nr:MULTISPECIES: hypothetical protein [Halorubrum]KOX97196.1 hypothetical protein AMR74_07165 [Halorubrum tropicale]RLM51738.1 hypothetical protein DVK06_04880 [Halorubrum sp. Atlit-28R]TKX42506.1 hypothetical protein EXE50_13730 [Halorubrum sp. ARQ200]TKX49895.1 hypothetical protein EXE49_08830 [Halorubrum sp. ASP121]TKX60903.1 hypothetical protein EXE48_10775 [Halorubrum sp. ASP1]